MSRTTLALPAVFLCALAAGLLALPASAQSDATIGIVSTDAVIAGNSATALGPLNACVRAEPGAPVSVDLVVDAVPADRGVIGFQVAIEYDPSLLTLTAVDNEFLLAAKGTFEPFEGLSDPLPDTDGDGRYTILVADLASRPPIENIESGKGVLSRLTFTAKGAGISPVAPSFDPPEVYPSIIDIQNTTIGVDSTGTASIAVGQDCDAAPEATPVIEDLPPIDQIPGFPTPVPTPTPVGQTPGPSGSGNAGTPTRPGSPGTANPGDGPDIATPEEGDGGTSAGAVAAVAALAAAGVALAGGGAWMLLRRRRGGDGA